MPLLSVPPTHCLAHCGNRGTHRMWGGLSGSRRSEGGSEYFRISFWMCFRCSAYQPSTAHHTCMVHMQVQLHTRPARVQWTESMQQLAQ